MKPEICERHGVDHCPLCAAPTPSEEEVTRWQKGLNRSAPSDTPPHDNSHWGETCPHPDCVKERAASSGSVPETTATKARPSDSKTNEELLNAFENAVDARAKTEIDAAFEETTQAEYQCANGIAAKAREDLVDRLNRLEGTVEEFGQRLAPATSRLSDAPTTEIPQEIEKALCDLADAQYARGFRDGSGESAIASDEDVAKCFNKCADAAKDLLALINKRVEQAKEDFDGMVISWNNACAIIARQNTQLAALRSATPTEEEVAEFGAYIYSAGFNPALASLASKLVLLRRSLSEIPAGDAK